MALQFNGESMRKIAELVDEYHDKQAALLPVLFVAQQQFGYLSEDAIKLVADTLSLELLHVKSVVSFYTMFKQQPIGKYHIQLCGTLSCAMGGSLEILEHLKKRLEIEIGEVSEDGKFSLEQVECLAMCDKAPAMIINQTNYGNLTLAKVDEILDNLE